VNAPGEGLRVPRAAAEPYRDFRGYAGQQNGRDLRGLAADDQSSGSGWNPGAFRTLC